MNEQQHSITGISAGVCSKYSYLDSENSIWVEIRDTWCMFTSNFYSS